MTDQPQPRKILIINTPSTADFEPDDKYSAWTPELRAEFEAADVVIGMFSPWGPVVLKGGADLEVQEARRRHTGPPWAMLEGSADQEVAAAQNAKLRRES